MKYKIQTHANISLNKYWGKRDELLFLPTKNSLTISLSELTTTTFIEKSAADEIFINNEIVLGLHKQKIMDFVDFFRKKFEVKDRFKINSYNNFPTAAGLASSSSGFAALALGLDKICDLKLSKKELSILARHGSGSAARSISGGFVLWHKGSHPDGSDCFAEQLFDHMHWPELRILVVVVKNQQKFMGSREGMRLTVATSPSYKSWIEKSERRLPVLIRAIKNKKFTTMGRLAQDDWQDMRRTMLDTTPRLNYWTDVSCRVIRAVEQMQNKNLQCYLTTEAGPNLKILCLEDKEKEIKNKLEKIPEIMQLITCKIATDPIIE
jgi:diphosphomevalonate decarboxylase